jgi:Family of unknown function (DUF6338)
MPSSVETLSIILILLPGFLCARIIQNFFVRPQQTELDKFVEALIYSFIIYVLFAITFRGGALDPTQPAHLAFLGASSVVLGLLVSAALTNDWVGRLLRFIRITQRTSNTSVWNDVFRLCGGYVLVELADGRFVVGWLRYFSDREEEASLFLEDASWVTSDGIRTHVDGPGMLLTRSSGIKHLMFLNAEESDQSAIAAGAGGIR